MNQRLLGILLDSFPKILLPGLTMTIPLTVISFSLALIIAVVTAMVQFANVKVLRSIIEKKREIFIDDMIESFGMTDAEVQKYLIS